MTPRQEARLSATFFAGITLILAHASPLWAAGGMVLHMIAESLAKADDRKEARKP